MLLIAALGCALTGRPGLAAEPGGEIVEPPAPRISAGDQRFLIWSARRAMEDRITGRSKPARAYRPPSLAETEAQAAVTLRMAGVRRGIGISTKRPVCDAVTEAALAALDDAQSKGGLSVEALKRMCLEMELIGEVAAAPALPSWSSFQDMRFMERGVHGLVVRFMDAQAAVRPSELIADNVSFAEAIENFANRANPGGEGVQARFVSWFRTQHWHEPTPGGEVVELQRGLTLLTPAAVSREGLTGAIEAVAEFMLYRQRPGGEFACEYQPSEDLYVEEASDVRQGGCAWTLALLAKEAPGDLGERAGRATDRALDVLKPRIKPLEGIDGAAFLESAAAPSKLGASALLALALSERPSPEHAAIRQRLLAGMRWLQRPSGRFITVFPPALEETGQEYAPGQTLLALARAHADEASGEIASSFGRALPFYREHFRHGRAVPLAAWQTRGFAAMARLNRERPYADFVFEMTDWLCDRQLKADNCRWPELHGGIDPRGRGEVDVTTATCLEALVDALLLARELSENGRAARYEQAVTAAARFVMQLQFRAEEAYYARSPRDCIGGIRAAPSDNRIRIEQCAHALRSLLSARAALFQQP